jgi:phage gpG-like protein
VAEDAVLKLEDSDIRRWKSALQLRLKEFAPILKRMYAIYGFKDIVDHFSKERGPDGPWKPRAQFTQELYAAIRAGHAKPAPGVARGAYSPTNKLLQLTGNLRKSILPSNAKTLNSRTILVFANDPKGGQHDRGRTKWPKIPARPFMWLSNGAKRNMLDAAARMVLDG